MKYRHKETGEDFEIVSTSKVGVKYRSAEIWSTNHDYFRKTFEPIYDEPLPDDSPVYISGGCPSDAPVGVTTTASAEPPDTPADKGKPERPVVTGAKYRHKETGKDFDAIVMNDTVFLSETGPCFPGRVWYDWGHELLNVFDPLPDDSLVQPGLGVIVDSIASAGTLPPDTPASTGTEDGTSELKTVADVDRFFTDVLESHIAELESDLAALRAENEGLKVDRAVLTDENARLWMDVTRWEAENARLKQIATDWGNKYETLKSKLAAAEALSEERRDCLARIEATILPRKHDGHFEMTIPVDDVARLCRKEDGQPEPSPAGPFFEFPGVYRRRSDGTLHRAVSFGRGDVSVLPDGELRPGFVLFAIPQSDFEAEYERVPGGEKRAPVSGSNGDHQSKAKTEGELSE